MVIVIVELKTDFCTKDGEKVMEEKGCTFERGGWLGLCTSWQKLSE